MKLLVDSAFSVLYFVISRKIGKNYGRCFKLKNGRLCGVIMCENYIPSFIGLASIAFILREEENNKTVLEIFSYGGIIPRHFGMFSSRFSVVSGNLIYQQHKQRVHNVSKMLKNLGFKYEILEEIRDFTSQSISSELEKLILEKGELTFEKKRLENIELKKEIVERREPVQFLPEKMRSLAPCPFLEISPEFSDIYICGVSKHVYVTQSSLSEKEAIDRCTGNHYTGCKNYLEALNKLKMCPFPKRRVVLPGRYIYICETSKYVQVPFSKLDEEDLLRYCVENRYYDCTYYLNTLNIIEKRIKEIEKKIAEK